MKYIYRFRFVLLIAYLSLLLWGILRPELPPEIFGNSNSDKWLHFLAFTVLSFLAHFVFSFRFEKMVWFLLVLSAILLEFLQALLQSSRFFSWEDVLANIVGVMIAFVFWTFVIKSWFADWKRDNL